MNLLRLLPVALSFLLLSAHFYRAGQWPLVALCLAAPLLLLLRKSWVPRLLQALLVLGALEWLRALYLLASMRIALGEPWTRLAAILVTVAVLTALSGLVFKAAALRRYYQTGAEEGS